MYFCIATLFTQFISAAYDAKHEFQRYDSKLFSKIAESVAFIFWVLISADKKGQNTL